MPAQAVAQGATPDMRDDDFVLIEYVHPNKGQHSVRGAETKNYYGQRARGDRFLVHRTDVAVQPHIFQIVRSAPLAEARQVPAAKLPEPEPISMPRPSFDLDLLPGVTPTISTRLAESGLDSKEAILAAGVTGLQEVKGIGKTRAEAIIKYLES